MWLFDFFKPKKKLRKINALVKSGEGKVRSNNEDNFYFNGLFKEDTSLNGFEYSCDCSEKIQLYAVCDGMGGVAYGEVASLIATSMLKKPSEENIADQITDNLLEINSAIEAKRQELLCTQMGTTFAGVYFFENKVICVNVGDSRVYLFRDGKLKQLSIDHSEAQYLVELGMLDAKNAREHAGHALTQFLGLTEDEGTPEPDYAEIEAAIGDKFLICSDGITDMLDDDAICNIFLEEDNINSIADRMFENCLEAGGRDNLTEIIIEVL